MPFSSLSLVPDEADAEAEDNDEVGMLAADFEIGHMLRDSIVPKAVLYFTGEAGDEDDEDVSPSTERYQAVRPSSHSLVRRR